MLLLSYPSPSDTAVEAEDEVKEVEEEEYVVVKSLSFCRFSSCGK